MFPVRFLGAGVAAMLLAAAAPGATDAAVDGATPLQWSVRLARSQMGREGDALAWGSPKAKWDYSAAVLALALWRLGERTGDPAYAQFAEKAVGSFVTPAGEIRTYRGKDLSLDEITPGLVVLALDARTGAERYRGAVAVLRRQIAVQPRTTEGGFWHKRRYPQQMWLDSAYMASPFLAGYAASSHQPADFDEAVKQLRLIGSHTYDPATGLYYHGWDESRTQAWADRTTGRSPSFWSRGMGWYGMALVDVLDLLPPAHPGRGELLAQLRRLAAGLARYQDPATGAWYQVTDQGARAGNYLEASGTAMFVYTLGQGVARGYLPPSYRSAACRGYAGLVRQFVRTASDGALSLTGICQVAGLGYGRNGTYDYYLSEPVVANDNKGVGPFILAGMAIDSLPSAP